MRARLPYDDGFFARSSLTAFSHSALLSEAWKWIARYVSGRPW
ncbi:hypothetical protein [Streptomyces sp. MS2.AVA.5]|uniref:Uncharacterized protein n=1 Tax=Streptomyces achmelvichensis TaxID=3134111 RepID=A0ACC6PMV7_9ACTN